MKTRYEIVFDSPNTTISTREARAIDKVADLLLTLTAKVNNDALDTGVNMKMTIKKKN